MNEENFHIFPGTIKMHFPGNRTSGADVIPIPCVRISAMLLLLIVGIKIYGLGVALNGGVHSRFCRN